MDLDLNVNHQTQHHKNQKPKKKKSKKRDVLVYILLWIVVLGLTAYFYWQKQAITEKNQILSKSIGVIEAQLIDDQSGQTLKSIAENKRILTEAKTYRTNWSEVMQAILVYEKNGVEFSSFSVGSDNRISVNARAKSVSAVKELLTKLQTSEEIGNPFVSTITENERDKDFAILFQLTFDLLS